jgi:hypothetical protein
MDEAVTSLSSLPGSPCNFYRQGCPAFRRLSQLTDRITFVDERGIVDT